ncbi:hypothetical protein [Guptibacillus algicola]|uniref:hypothetical protein n=1 Tax=Guptibacillus algicola TaxID=225844 RepID=UPI001CD36195|nr:hypothetical protein [Alkalihalobacillus algicola]MCA0987826.1 hypothetical protein [Alkalihalobacillus algicola]
MSYSVIIGLILVVLSFGVFLMGLLKFIPSIVGILLLFLSILFTVSMFNKRNQFRGFH